jgi:hypothetical protein
MNKRVERFSEKGRRHNHGHHSAEDCPVAHSALRAVVRIERVLGLNAPKTPTDPVSLREDVAAVEYLSRADSENVSPEQLLDWARFFHAVDKEYFDILAHVLQMDATPLYLMAAAHLEFLAEQRKDTRAEAYVRAAKRTLQGSIYLHLRQERGSRTADRRVADPRASRHEKILELVHGQ